MVSKTMPPQITKPVDELSEDELSEDMLGELLEAAINEVSLSLHGGDQV